MVTFWSEFLLRGLRQGSIGSLGISMHRTSAAVTAGWRFP
jgi:hypothetical protein